MAVKEGVASFSISGASFTELVQARMLDDNPGAAFRLASSLLADGDNAEMMVADTAIKLCDGVARLVGNGACLRLEKHTDKAYQEKLRWLYAGRVRVKSLWYRPIAYVTNVGPMDMRNTHGRSVNPVWGGGGYTNRAWHYAGCDEVVCDGASYKDKDGMAREVIFEQCSEPPHWRDVPRDPQEALTAFLAAGHGLEERSHSKWYPTKDEPARRRKTRTSADPDPKVVEADLQVEEAEAREEQLARAKQIARLREQIMGQAGDDLVELSWEEDRSPHDKNVVLTPAGRVMIPRAPFMHWAFAKVPWLVPQLPPWTPVSPIGMKMQMDDPCHTDWVIAAGFDPLDRRLYYGGAYGIAATELRIRLQDEADLRVRTNATSVTTLVMGPRAVGFVVHGSRGKSTPVGSVVVLPNLRPDYLAATVGAAAVITEAGGETAHLAQIGRERGLLIVLVEKALELFPSGALAEVDGASRIARVIDRETHHHS